MVAIELDNLTLRAGKKIIVDKVNLKLERSSRTALLGASGSGKTSLLRAIAGFIRPETGRVLLFGENVTRIPAEKRDVSMLFQEPVLFPGLTIQENAKMALGKEGREQTADSKIKLLARDFVIDDKLSRRVDSGISGGEWQRAALLRVFSNKKPILLLDEPLRGALNVELKWQLLHAIRKRISDNDITTVVVTHDFCEAAYLAERIVVMHDGNTEFGSPEEIYNHPPNLGVALVLGPGNAVEAGLLGSIKTRDGQFPLVIEGGMPAIRGETDILFFRPEKLSVQPASLGFKVVDNRFLGNSRRLRLKAPNEKEIEAHVPPETKQMTFASVSIKAHDIVVFNSLCRRRD